MLTVTLFATTITADVSTSQRRRIDEAAAVLKEIHAAPDNLLALKCMSELQARAGDGSQAEPAKADVHAAAEPLPAKSLSFAAPPVPAPVADPAPEPVAAPPPPHPALGELERWQARLQTDRAQRTR